MSATGAYQPYACGHDEAALRTQSDGSLRCSGCPPLEWTGPTCGMCNGTGVYPYRPHPQSLTNSGPIKWARCGACNGNGRDAA
jgi:hypothetical protein